jgi:hypothetical protein
MGLAALKFGEACHSTEEPRKIGALEIHQREWPHARIRLGCPVRDQADEDGFVRSVVKDGVVEISFAFFPLTSINE